MEVENEIIVIEMPQCVCNWPRVLPVNSIICPNNVSSLLCCRLQTSALPFPSTDISLNQADQQFRQAISRHRQMVPLTANRHWKGRLTLLPSLSCAMAGAPLPVWRAGLGSSYRRQRFSCWKGWKDCIAGSKEERNHLFQQKSKMLDQLNCII